MGPAETSVEFDGDLPVIGAIILKLFEVTELMFKCTPVGDEGDFWHLICPITSMEIHLMVYPKTYIIFWLGIDLATAQLNSNDYLKESALFALQELGGRPEKALEAWAGESWSTAKWRWNSEQINRRRRK
jgi:hypothetical protein